MRLVPLALAALALAPAILAPAALAQSSDSVYVGPLTVLTPGHPDLTAAAPQSVDYEIRASGRTLGHFTRTETVTGDRLVIASHLTMPAQQRDQRDTTVVTWPGLQPVSRSFVNGEETYRLTYAGGRVAGRSVLGNLDEPIDAPLGAGVFGEGVSWLIARSVPLRDGYTATFQTADQRGDLSAGTVVVTGHDGDAWTVTVALAGEPTYTHTIDGATRGLRRATFSPQPSVTVEFAPPAAAPTGPVLRPGDAALSTAWMTDETSTYTLNLVEPMAMEVGTSTFTRTTEGDVVTSAQTISVPSQGINGTQTARAHRATLAPISQTTAGQQAVELTFTDGAVSGTKQGAPVSVAFAAPVFDSTWSAEIAQSLPLAEGYTATAEVYDATNGLSTVTFAVGAQLTVDGAAAWTVESVSPNGPVTYVIDAGSRRLLSMRISPQPGVVVELRRQP